MAADTKVAKTKRTTRDSVYSRWCCKRKFLAERPGLFSPDPNTKQEGVLPSILAPFELIKDKLLLVKGVDNQIRGDGDGHMRGIGCLLTGIELFPGNIQGGSHTQCRLGQREIYRPRNSRTFASKYYNKNTVSIT